MPEDNSTESIAEFRKKILDWYDRNRRKLPWRAEPWETPDPYHVWLSEVMLQQTTVPAVIPYFLRFIEKWPTVQSLAEAGSEVVMREWAGLGYYARARNLHKCAKVIASNYAGTFPKDQAELRKLPGVGDYTSAAIAAIAFGLEANVVDGNIERIMARYHAVSEPLPRSKKRLKELAGQLSLEQTQRTGDYAQALMDIGATICTPKSPRCALCPLSSSCMAYAKSIQEGLPQKTKKADKPQKVGNVYWIVGENGDVLLHKRPDRGLLGGMFGFPTSGWDNTGEDRDLIKGVLAGNEAGTVKHSFTHFDLTLHVKVSGWNSAITLPDGYQWIGFNNLSNYGFPTVFRKIVRLMTMSTT